MTNMNEEPMGLRNRTANLAKSTAVAPTLDEEDLKRKYAQPQAYVYEPDWVDQLVVN